MRLSLQNFAIREADWETDKSVLLELRKQVFIVEQSVPPEEEFDGLDDTSYHWLVQDAEARPIGTGRLLDTGQIGRMAVLDQYPKYVVTMDEFWKEDVEGVKHLQIHDFLLCDSY